jgi:hypothetical protein
MRKPYGWTTMAAIRISSQPQNSVALGEQVSLVLVDGPVEARPASSRPLRFFQWAWQADRSDRRARGVLIQRNIGVNDLG